MKLIFGSCVILSLMILSEADIICRDNETNQEFLATDSHIAERLSQFSRIFDRRMRDLTDKLNNQCSNSYNGKETQVENIASQQQHLNEKIINLSENLEMRTETLGSQLDRIEVFVSNYPTRCREALQSRGSGIYKIKFNEFSSEPFDVFCDADRFNGGWMVVARRFDQSVDFNRNWNEYKYGFGDLKGDFFIGLDKLHALTSNGLTSEVIIILFAEIGKLYGYYDSFAIGNENEGYALKNIGNFTGQTIDFFGPNVGIKFTTKDNDNDDNIGGNCAKDEGPWWHRKCNIPQTMAIFDQYPIYLYETLQSVEILIRPHN